MKRVLLLILVIILSSSFAAAIEIDFFYGETCPHCQAEEPFLHGLESKYPDLKINYYEVFNDAENRDLFKQKADEIGISSRGVPVTILAGSNWIGYSNSTAVEIEEKVKELSNSEVSDVSNVTKKVEVNFFYGYSCPHCKKEKPFLASLEKKYPELKINYFEVYKVPENQKLFKKYAKAYDVQSTGVPLTLIGDKSWVGYTEKFNSEIENKIVECLKVGCQSPLNLGYSNIDGPGQAETTVDIPFIGSVDAKEMSLPALTFVLGFLDGFNPCAFFVLLFLLSMLIYARSRSRMLLIGGTFVFFSGFVYFLFMAAWLNIFLLLGKLVWITVIAGLVAVIIAVINIKDFFFFKKGISLSLSDKAKPKLFDRMRGLLKADSILNMLVGTIVLAVAANMYELLCTAGFPMVFTRILTLNDLSSIGYYTYLIAYNVVYVMPLLIIVLIFTYTLGAKKLSEWQGRVLKLMSGVMMLALGLVLLLNPELLNNIFVSIGLIAFAIIVALVIVAVTRDAFHKKTDDELEGNLK